jgi:NADH:ubiquinone oxidoreductase subunit E
MSQSTRPIVPARPLIPLLMLVQRERGWVDNPGVNFLAKFLNLEVTDIWETATFYSMFNLPPGRPPPHPDLQNAVLQDHG